MNGLYSIHVSLGDGRSGKGSGVLVLQDGNIFGGDAFLFYVGRYEIQGTKMKGEVVIDQHTPSPGQLPLFGGKVVGIGFAGAVGAEVIELNGTALVGNTSQIFRATLKKLATQTDRA